MRAKIEVKLTPAQWKLVTEAVFEWGVLCEYESETESGMCSDEKMLRRSKKLGDIASQIGIQVEDGIAQRQKRKATDLKLKTLLNALRLGDE